MLTVRLEGVPSRTVEVMTSAEPSGVPLTTLQDWLCTVLPVPTDVYFIHNGKRLEDDSLITDGVVRIVPRLVGGKGGFGSMLRAIGAQIEKTTNREACRDLSGRRLRDINEEKRLKNWISKKADREREALERKQKKLDKLRSEPKIEFKDKKYEEERSKLPEVVHDAVEKGFQASTSSASSSNPSKKPVKRKGFMLEDEEFSDSSVSSSDESENGGDKAVKQASESETDSDEPRPAKRQHLTEGSDSSQQPRESSNESSEEETSHEVAS